MDALRPQLGLQESLPALGGRARTEMVAPDFVSTGCLSHPQQTNGKLRGIQGGFLKFCSPPGALQFIYAGSSLIRTGGAREVDEPVKDEQSRCRDRHRRHWRALGCETQAANEQADGPGIDCLTCDSTSSEGRE